MLKTNTAGNELRELKIKTGVVVRLGKELSAYEKESIKQQERIDKLIANGEDEYTVRKQREVLEETTLMIPDCKKRLAAARVDLASVLDTIVAKSEEAESIEEVVLARQALAV
ncbi:hypothetical protein HDU76_014051 [Blyttiomyces sp. JEL0837]|nr:hypothetical protein HDU76_014051 [Blyttiomyces sp. JEL0837]